MKAILLAPEFASCTEGGLPGVMRACLTALAATPAVSSLVLVVLHDPPEKLASLGDRIAGKPLQVVAAAGSKTVFARAAWAAASRANRVVCGHVALLSLAAVALRPGARLALLAHGPELWARLSPRRQLAMRRVDRVLCLSQHTRERLAENHPALAPRLRVLPGPVSGEFLDGDAPSPPPVDHPPVVLHTGALREDASGHGAELLLRAFALIPRAAFHHHPELMPRLRFVGGGEALPRLRTLAADLHLTGRVDFDGPLDEAGRRRALADCACLAEPSTALGCGAPFLEALAVGRPCVGVRAGATPEFVRSELGVIAPPDDPVALAAALAECISRTWDPAALRAACLEHSPARFETAFASSWR